MRGWRRLFQALIPAVLSLLLFAFGTRIVFGEEQDKKTMGQVREEVESSLWEEFDFQEITESLNSMFPEEKVSFEELVASLTSGDGERAIKTAAEYLSDQIGYEFKAGRKNLIYMLLIALVAAVFTNFSGVFKNPQVSEISFYILYMLLITLCLTAFRTAVNGMEEQIASLTEFMQVLCPSFFLAVAFSSGSTTALTFYNMILILIYVVEVIVLKLLIPMVNIYIMVNLLSNLTGEDLLSQMAQLINKGITWCIRALLTCVVGVNLVQGMIAPAIDSLKQSVVTRTAEAMPWIGNAVGGVAETILGTAVLIKNGIGMAGAIVVVLICAIPVFQMLILSLFYKLAAAFVQPVSDKRITSCIAGVSEGYELLVKVIFTSGVLFLLTIGVVAAATT